jgi:hypothetical protein
MYICFYIFSISAVNIYTEDEPIFLVYIYLIYIIDNNTKSNLII